MSRPPLVSPYGYIAIEGNIGAGKTTLATHLADRLGAQLLLERFEENPFLERFYADPAAHGFSVELAFVSDRWKQLRDEIGRRNLFRPTLIADYTFAKSLVFARENLPPAEFALFENLFGLMAGQIPVPEVIAILDPPDTRIQAQIATRGRSYEQNLPPGYLDKIMRGYRKHYRSARGSRVLWIDSSPYDILERPDDLERLADLILAPRKVGVYRV
jgi:deoxyadenosine/deoxycytidine kinase